MKFHNSLELLNAQQENLLKCLLETFQFIACRYNAFRLILVFLCFYFMYTPKEGKAGDGKQEFNHDGNAVHQNSNLSDVNWYKQKHPKLHLTYIFYSNTLVQVNEQIIGIGCGESLLSGKTNLDNNITKCLYYPVKYTGRRKSQPVNIRFSNRMMIIYMSGEVALNLGLIRFPCKIVINQ